MSAVATQHTGTPVTAEELAKYFGLPTVDTIEDPDSEAGAPASELPSDDEEFAAGPGESA